MTTVGIVIPAHDEAELVGDAVRAVVAACGRVDATCVVVVVDDGSSDGTTEVAREALDGFAGLGSVVVGSFGRASTARCAGIDLIRAVVADPADTWVLSTDADSVVPPTWIQAYLAHHERGSVAVAGIVDLLDEDALWGERWRRDYGATVGADLAHPHVHAANLGIRFDVYDEVGGFTDLDRIEDIDLWRKVRAAGYVPVADGSIVVSTSARFTGRVEVGFAHALRRLYGDDQEAVGAAS